MRFKKIMLADPNVLAREGLKQVLGERQEALVFVEAADDEGVACAVQNHSGFDLIIVHASLLSVGQSPELSAYLYKTPTCIILLCDALSPALDAKIKCFDIKAAISCQESLARIKHRILEVLEPSDSADSRSGCLSRANGGVAEVNPSEQHGVNPHTDHLTPRQAVVLSYLKAGLTNREIAAEMGIQASTVKRHVSDILQKLEVKKRTQLIAGVTV